MLNESQPTLIDYASDADVSFTYDQQGRRRTMVDGSGTTSWTYDVAGRPVSETQGRSQRVLRYLYDGQSHRAGLEVERTGDFASVWRTTYGYDNAGRMHTVLDDRLPGNAPYTYTYLSNASLIGQVTSPGGLKTIQTYDTSGRLQTTAAERTNGTVVNSFAYRYDAAGQRDQETTPSRVREYAYDEWRQLLQAKTTADNVETMRHEYAFDGIGNRLTASRTMLNSPAELATYTTNVVNQYTAMPERWSMRRNTT